MKTPHSMVSSIVIFFPFKKMLSKKTLALKMDIECNLNVFSFH